MLTFVYPATFNYGFLVTNENTSIAFAEMVAYIENLNPNTVLNQDVTITSTGSFTISLIDVASPSDSNIDNSAYSITFDIYANSSVTPAEAAATYVWTFSDVNGTCTASFAIPTLTLQSTPGNIGDGSNGSQLIYQSNLSTTQYLYGTTTPSYQAVFVGNSVTLNVIGCLPSQPVIIYTFDGSTGSEAYANSTTDANGAISYTVTVPAGSDPYEFLVQGSYYFDNTAETNFFSFSNYPILFDQTTIVANSDLFSGYAFTTVDTSSGSYVPATVSLYADGVLLGNTITSNTGVWTFVPPTFSSGTYAITAAAIPQEEPQGNTFNWIYSNASTNLVVATTQSNSSNQSSNPQYISTTFNNPILFYANSTPGFPLPVAFTSNIAGFAANSIINVTNPVYPTYNYIYPNFSSHYHDPDFLVIVGVGGGGNGIFANVTNTGYTSLSTIETPTVWTFTDTLSNSSVSATFSFPYLNVLGNTIYQSGVDVSTLTVGANTSSLEYNYVMLGNSATINIVGVASPNQSYTVVGAFATNNNPIFATLGTYTADANGTINYNLSVGQNSVSYYSEIYIGNSNQPSIGLGPIIFDQHEIISANASVIVGYAFTPYDANNDIYILSNVSVYLDNILLGNTITNSSGYWTYVPPSLSNGTYAITATAIPQMEPAGGLFTWPYSNASADLVIASHNTLNLGNGGQGASGIVIIEW